MRTDHKQLIKDAFLNVVGNTTADQQVIAQFFHPEYQQYVDGVKLDYNGFVQHMKAQKEIIKSVTVSFRNLVSEGDIVFSNHDVLIKKKTGGIIRAHVLAEFTVNEGKIIRCDELTRLEEGDEEDRDIGSRTGH